MFNYKRYKSGYYRKNRNKHFKEKDEKKDEKKEKYDSDENIKKKEPFNSIRKNKKTRGNKIKHKKSVRFSKNLVDSYEYDNSVEKSQKPENKSIFNWDISFDVIELI